MPLQATSGAASYDAFGGGVAVVPTYIEDVFSTYLYTGDSTNRSIVNNIDLSGKGGLVWIKDRNAGLNHTLFDTARGATNYLFSDTTGAQSSASNTLTAFNSNGFSLGTNSSYANGSGYTYVSWSLRKQPKFFDIVTYTGNGTSPRQISHNLGSTPGCVMIKKTSGAADWVVWNRGVSSPTGAYGVLNSTVAFGVNSDAFYFSNPTSTYVTVGSADTVNTNGATYVMYLFAHDAGGFGLTGTDNVISCGSFTTNGSGNATVSLGYEPQFVLYKKSSTTGQWYIEDTMRGLYAPTTLGATLIANLSNAESAGNGSLQLTSTGFTVNPLGNLGTSTTCIYIAIRRGPMKVPTTGTKVFSPTAVNNAQGTVNTTGFPIDMQIMNIRSGYAANGVVSTRLLGVSSNTTSSGTYLRTPSASAETTGSDITQYWDNTGFQTSSNWASSGMIYWSFGRAPSCMDVVCYTGTGVAGATFNHNLGVVPELMIVKKRSGTTASWYVYASALGNTKYILLNETAASVTSSTLWNNTSPTASVFSLGSSAAVNDGNDCVNYLFATCAGVSKVGGYTGTGTTLQIDCGFTAGARFILIKRTDSTGGWYVWDSARGIIAGNDPYLLLNSTAAEVTNTDYVDTYAAGFEISSTAPAAINASGGSFIFLAIS